MIRTAYPPGWTPRRMSLGLMGLACVLAGPAAAQQTARVVREVRFEQRLDAEVPLDLEFRDHTGSTVRLKDLVHDKPVILSLVYYECPMLCTQVLNGLSASLKRMDSLRIGADFDVVTVSIDPEETAELAAKKHLAYTKALGQPGAEAGWHFLTGDQAQIAALADVVGFRYFYDEEIGEYAHPGGFAVLTPGGRVSRYFIDVVFPPIDLRLALVESSEGRIGSLIDAITLLCYQHDPITGKYGFVVQNVIRLLGGLTVALLVGYVVFMLRREKRALRAALAHEPSGS